MAILTPLLTLRLRLQPPRDHGTSTSARGRCKRAERGPLNTVACGVVHGAANVSASHKRLDVVVLRIT